MRASLSPFVSIPLLSEQDNFGRDICRTSRHEKEKWKLITSQPGEQRRISQKEEDEPRWSLVAYHITSRSLAVSRHDLACLVGWLAHWTRSGALRFDDQNMPHNRVESAAKEQ